MGVLLPLQCTFMMGVGGRGGHYHAGTRLGLLVSVKGNCNATIMKGVKNNSVAMMSKDKFILIINLSVNP